MALIAGLTLAAGAYGADQAGDAADAQAKAARRAGKLTQRQWEETQGNLSPYRTIGDQSIGRISRVLGLGGDAPNLNEFYQDPGYQFRLNEANRAFDASGSARGMNLSGAQIRARDRYNQGLASQEFGNWFNRLYGLGSMGQNAAVQTGNFGANAAANQGNYLMAGGAAKAQGIQDRTNFITSGLQGLGTIYGQSGYQNYQNKNYQNNWNGSDPNMPIDWGT